MAYEADKVVVELIAQNDRFNADVRSSAATYEQSMGVIEKSGTGAEASHKRLTASIGNSRIGMMEFQHVARGMTDQIASGASPTQALASHMAMLGEAVSLSGGAFGSVGALLQGPWGLAVTGAISVVALLIAKHQEEGGTLEDLIRKLEDHKEKTALSEEAERVWSHTIEGLIERSKKLNDELTKRLTTQTELNSKTLQGARADFAAAQATAARLDTASPDEQNKQVVVDGKKVTQLQAAQEAIHNAAIALHNAEVAAAEEAGAAMASLSAAADRWADEQLANLKKIQGYHPELSEKPAGDELYASYNRLKSAISGAAAANINFNDTVQQTNRLNQELLNGTISVDAYEKAVLRLADALDATVAAAKDAPQAVEAFKRAVIGAEGTGKNRLGSSAEGYGQFMPGTFESYFKRLYPQQASGMSNGEIDALRNNRQVATAVIDAATKDYTTVLQRAGQQITAAGLYTVHLLGAGDARKLLGAPSGQDTSAFLSAGVLRGNPFLRGSAGSARAAIAKRIGDSSSAVSSGAAALDTQMAEEAKQEQKRWDNYQNASAKLEDDLIAAKGKLALGTEAQAAAQIEKIKNAEKDYDDQVDQQIKNHELGELEGALLKIRRHDVTVAQIKAVEDEKQAKVAEDTYQALEQAQKFRVADLKFAEDMASSQAEKRLVELAIVNAMYEQRKLELEHTKDLAIRNGATQQQIDTIQGQIDHLGVEHDQDVTRTERSTAGPWESFLQGLPQDARAANEAMQSLASDGIRSVGDGLADAGTQWIKLHGIAGDAIKGMIAGLIKLAFYQGVLKLFGGGGGVAPGLGKSAFPIVNGVDPLAPLPGRAIGGPVAIGQPYVVGEKGPELFVPGASGQIIPNNSSAASPMSGAPSVLVVKVEPNDDRFDAYVAGIAGPLAVQSGTRGAYGGAALARSNLARRQTHQLGSRG